LPTGWRRFREVLPKSDGEIRPDLHTFFGRLEKRGGVYRLVVRGIREVKHFILS